MTKTDDNEELKPLPKQSEDGSSVVTYDEETGEFDIAPAKPSNLDLADDEPTAFEEATDDVYEGDAMESNTIPAEELALAEAHLADAVALDDTESAIAAAAAAGLIDLEDPRVINYLAKMEADELEAKTGYRHETVGVRRQREEQEAIDAIPEPVFPEGHPYFTVKSGGAGSGKTIHVVAYNHVSKASTNLGVVKAREFMPLTVEMAELLTEAGFSHCKACAKSVAHAKQVASLGPLIRDFEDLALDAAEAGVEIRLMAYPSGGAKTGSGREVYSSIDVVRRVYT